MAEPDPVVQVIPWDLKDCGRISVEITASGKMFVNGEGVEPIEVTRAFFAREKSVDSKEIQGRRACFLV